MAYLKKALNRLQLIQNAAAFALDLPKNLIFQKIFEN